MAKQNFHVMNIDHRKTRKAPAAGQHQRISKKILFGRNFLKEKHVTESFPNRKFPMKIYLCTAQQQDDDAHPEKHIVKP